MHALHDRTLRPGASWVRRPMPSFHDDTAGRGRSPLRSGRGVSRGLPYTVGYDVPATAERTLLVWSNLGRCRVVRAAEVTRNQAVDRSNGVLRAHGVGRVVGGSAGHSRCSHYAFTRWVSPRSCRGRSHSCSLRLPRRSILCVSRAGRQRTSPGQALRVDRIAGVTAQFAVFLPVWLQHAVSAPGTPRPRGERRRVHGIRVSGAPLVRV